jgi:hypothetical protein
MPRCDDIKTTVWEKLAAIVNFSVQVLENRAVSRCFNGINTVNGMLTYVFSSRRFKTLKHRLTGNHKAKIRGKGKTIHDVVAYLTRNLL